MDINMLYGIVIIGFIALVAMIGIFSDTRNRGGFKWFLIFLILVGAGAAGAREYLQDKVDKKDQKKLDDAVALAKTSNKLAEEEIRSHESDVLEFAKERNGLESEIVKCRESSVSLVSQMSSMFEAFDEMEKAATRVRKPDIAEIGLKARLDASKKLMAVAKEGEWMAPADITKIEAGFKDDLPLKKKQFKEISSSLKNKSLGGGDDASE